MTEQTKGKRVPWSYMEQYLATHQRTIVAFQDLLKSSIMDIPQIEAMLPNSFMQLHQLIGKILKDNGILSEEEQSKVDEMSLIVKTVMKLQSTLITQNTTNQEEIKSVIRQMKPEITSLFGASMQQEVSTLLESLGGMTEIIEANFSQIKEIMQEHKEDLIRAIT